MKAWWIEKHGGPDVLKQIEVDEPSPLQDEVKIQVSAVGLNHLDLWVRKGVPGHRFPLPLIPGGDITGRIQEWGKLSSSSEARMSRFGFKEGTPVIVQPMTYCGECSSCLAGFPPTCRQFGMRGESTHGGCTEYIIAPVKSIVPLPSEMSFAEGAALPTAYVTAWSMLHRKAKIQPEDLILIHAGGSGVSIAAIQMAKRCGATVVTTVGSQEKARRAQELGADHTILYRQNDFRSELKEIARSLDKRGADIILDHVGVDTFGESLKSLNWGGRLVTCGATSGAEVSLDLKLIFFKNLSILGSTMGGDEDLEKVVEMVRKKEIRSIVDQVFPMEELPEAHRHLESRQAFGKVVVTR